MVFLLFLKLIFGRDFFSFFENDFRENVTL